MRVGKLANVMDFSEVAVALVSKAVQAVNDQLTESEPLVDHPSTRLLDEDGVIDSLAFAFFIVTIEQFALDDFDMDIVLVDDEVLDMDIDSVDNPFLTIGTLTDYVAKKLA